MNIIWGGKVKCRLWTFNKTNAVILKRSFSVSKCLSFTQQPQAGCRNAASSCRPGAPSEEVIPFVTSCDMEIAGVSTHSVIP